MVHVIMPPMLMPCMFVFVKSSHFRTISASKSHCSHCKTHVELRVHYTKCLSIPSPQMSKRNLCHCGKLNWPGKWCTSAMQMMNALLWNIIIYLTASSKGKNSKLAHGWIKQICIHPVDINTTKKKLSISLRANNLNINLRHFIVIYIGLLRKFLATIWHQMWNKGP